MRGNRVIAAAAIVAAVAGCAPEPPPYESRYTPPPPAAPPAPPLPEGSSFLDNFDRPDTPLGLGDGWDMRQSNEPDDRSPILPPATDGFIRGGHFSSANNTSVYAARVFSSTVRRVGAEAFWTRVGSGPGETLIMAITANDQLTTDLLQLAVTRSGWVVSQRRGGHFHRLDSGEFDPPLELDRQYRFEMDAADGQVTVRAPGTEKLFPAGTIGLLGNRAFWRIAFDPAARPIGVPLAMNMVWVAEEGQPLAPLPPPA